MIIISNTYLIHANLRKKTGLYRNMYTKKSSRLRLIRISIEGVR